MKEVAGVLSCCYRVVGMAIRRVGGRRRNWELYARWQIEGWICCGGGGDGGESGGGGGGDGALVWFAFEGGLKSEEERYMCGRCASVW